MRPLLLFASLTAVLLLGCGRQHAAQPAPLPAIIAHTAWESRPSLGYVADAMRRNTKAGDTLSFHDLGIEVLGTGVDSSATRPVPLVRLRLSLHDKHEVRALFCQCDGHGSAQTLTRTCDQGVATF